MKDLMPTGQVETYEAKVTSSVALPCGLGNPPSVERDSECLELSNSENYWQSRTLGELAITTSGGTPSRSRKNYYDGSIPWVKSGELNDSYIYDTEEHITEEGLNNSSAKLFPSGTVLIALYGATVGKTSILQTAASTNQAVCGITPGPDLDASYLRYYLISIREELLSHRYGGAQPNISQQIVRNQKISYPPLPEQKKIAHILSTVKRAIEAQERIIQITTELKKALMHKLFTEGLRNEPQKQTEIGLVPESWAVVKICDVTEVKGGKRLPKNDKIVEHNTGFPYIRVTDFNEYSVDMCGIRFLTKTAQKQISRYIINQTDVFISIAGSIGITGMIPPELDGANLTENAARLIVNDSAILQPRFLMYWLASHHCQAEIKAQTVKNAQPKLALARIKSLNAPLPSLEEQVEITTAMDLTKRKTDNARSKRDLLQDLFRILLHELMTAKTRVHKISITI